MIRIVADDKIPFLKGVLEPFAQVTYLPGKRIVREMLEDTEALLIRTRTKCTETLLKGTAVSFIGTATIGFDHIDTQFCKKSGIKWTNAPGCNSSSVKQYMAAALLKISSDFGFSLKNRTIGIVGVGHVGSKVEKFARLLGMNVLLNDPPRERKEGIGNFEDLYLLLRESDIVTLHVPLNTTGEDRTYHLFNEELLKKMKKGAWLINTSRGEVVETSALNALLSSGRLGGAVVDVWENEPDIDLELMNKVFIATHHIAGYSADGKANGTSVVVNALSRHFKFPLKKWYPDTIPAPPSPIVNISCDGKSDEDIIREAVNHTYKIETDNNNLRKSPYNFEILRGDYPLRREFHAYTVYLKSGTDKIAGILKEMGFRLP